MKAHVLKGSKQEIADLLVRLSGVVREAIVFEEEPVPASAHPATHGADDLFTEMKAHMVVVSSVDDSRENIYSRMEGE